MCCLEIKHLSSNFWLSEFVLFVSYLQSGPGRGRSNMPPQSPYSSSSMLQNPPTPQSQAYDTYTGSSLEGADPSSKLINYN